MAPVPPVAPITPVTAVTPVAAVAPVPAGVTIDPSPVADGALVAAVPLASSPPADGVVVPPTEGQSQTVQSQDQELATCVICQDVMQRDERVLTLWCDHKFHEGCVLEWRQCANKSETQCPFRCGEPVDPRPVCLVYLLLLIFILYCCQVTVVLSQNCQSEIMGSSSFKF